MDGVDGVVVDFTNASPRVLASEFLPYPESLRQTFLSLNMAGHDELHRAAVAAHQLVHLYASVCHTLLDALRLSPQAIRAIGSHGQTVRHQPPGAGTAYPYTLQLNQPALLAELTKIPVVADFRTGDMAAGGQGAPLVPPFHAAVFAAPGKSRAVVNIGGIANITTLTADGLVKGLDTGPGNALLDGWCQLHTGRPFDRGGEWGASGHPDQTLLSRLLAHPFFELRGVKSTGRDQFHLAWVQSQLDDLDHLSPQDVQATLALLTATTISQTLLSQSWRDTLLSDVIVCGGGSKNTHLMNLLQDQMGSVSVACSDDHGWRSEWVEPAAFAWLARQHVQKLPGNLPEVTGATRLRVLGAYYPS